MTIVEYINHRIIELCQERNLSFSALGRLSELPATTIKNILNGDSQNPGIVTIQKICNGFGLTLIEFFDTEEFHALEPKFPK
ncbi:MAG: helix-turn-helix transcriptional regulator [Bacteroidaceae bacterium]|nr:helix-turn-helix transcriptional regulator [Clostridia bacterium]MBR6602370.1 helix-turn-helix transcriptional regulator [Bacteroidaceae bacterium]